VRRLSAGWMIHREVRHAHLKQRRYRHANVEDCNVDKALGESILTQGQQRDASWLRLFVIELARSQDAKNRLEWGIGNMA